MTDIINFASQYLSGAQLQIFVTCLILMFVTFMFQFFGWMFGRR